MAGLISRPRGLPGRRAVDVPWVGLLGVAAALTIGVLLTFSVQATCAFVLIILVVALYLQDRAWGIAAMFALWFVAPALRRILALITGQPEHDPLSLAPFVATGVIAAFELARVHLPTSLQRVLLLAGAGFALGLPLGAVVGPQAAAYALIAYLAGLSGAALGFSERLSLQGSTLRKVLLFAVPVIAVYAIAQRAVPLTPWDQTWLDVTEFGSIGASRKDEVRVFGTLNSPGTLAPLLGLSLLCFLTVVHHRTLAVVGAVLLTVALALTLVRSAWIALMVAGIAHVVASRGQSARLVFGLAAVTVAATLALAPVSTTAHDVLDRFNSIATFRFGGGGEDTSASERSTTFSRLLPEAAGAPLGHGLGSAGEPSKLSGETELRATDNGYLSLMYQVGPIGFLLVMAALAAVLRAAWIGARARAPGQDIRLLLFAMLVFLMVQLVSGDSFYGVHGVILWFIAGQVLAYEYRTREAARQRHHHALVASR